jgi:cytochrome c oxidase cbb3-type subunit 3
MTHDPHESPAGPTVEMPRPTFAPLLLSLGLVLGAAGVALGPAFVTVGVLLFFLGLINWVGELLPGRGHEHEPATEHPAPVVPRPGTVEELVPGAVGYRFRLPEKIHPVSAGIKGGLVGGAVMTLPALTWGLLTGHGIWFPVNLLAGALLPNIDHMPVSELEQFSPVLLAIGIVMHVAMSATIGLAYGVLLPMLPGSDRGHLIAGGVVLPLLWTGTSFGLMGVANPVLQEHVDWYWFAASQFVFGLAAALVVIRSERVFVPPAGPGSRQAEQAALLLAVLLPLAGGCHPPGKPVPTDEAAAAVDFGKLFAENCAGCHGPDGKNGPAPVLNDPLALALLPDAEVVKVLTDGRPPTPMPAFLHPKGALSDAQMKAVVAGLKTAWVKPAAPPGVPAYSAKEAGDAGRGAAVYAKACAGCHGDKGQGVGDTGPLNDPAFLALVSDQRLRRTAIVGRPDLGCPRYDEAKGRPADFKPLTDQDVTDVTAWLASWRKKQE